MRAAATRTRTNLRWLFGFVAGATLLSLTPPASADVQACLAASEKGQRARTAGKLREAREHFVICGAESCPNLVRHDCAQWNSELAQTLPTVVFGAKDKQGRDLFDVTVSMDGETIVKKLDGKSVTVDPGKHTFRFEVAGMPAVTEVVLIKEGERARVFNVTFDANGGSSTGAVTGTGPTPGSGDGTTKPPPKDEGGHTPYPWIVVGIGAIGVAVGTVIVATSPDRPGNCNEDTEKCTRLPGQSEADFQSNQEQAGTADSQPLLGFGVIGVGAAVLIGGLLWHFLEPVGPSSSGKVRVLPFTTGKTSGFALGGTF